MACKIIVKSQFVFTDRVSVIITALKPALLQDSFIFIPRSVSSNFQNLPVIKIHLRAFKWPSGIEISTLITINSLRKWINLANLGALH